jgi:protein SCO1/2
MKTWQMLCLCALVLFFTLVGCKEKGEDKPAGVGEYEVRGKVVAVDAAKSVLTLDHEDIPGLMRAMQMDFKVADAKLLEGIKVGDQVQGRLKKSDTGYFITRLRKR